MVTIKNKSLATILFLSSFIFVIASIINKKTPDSIKTNNHVLTVFIHGTIFNYPSFKILKKTCDDKESKDNFLTRYTNNMRYNGIYKNQPINDYGLIPVDFNKKNKKTKISNSLMSLYKKNYQDLNKNKNQSLYFYTFGWDGKLDNRKRKLSGFKLYEELIQEIEKLKKEKNISTLTIEILAHSHGGNVALYLADAEEKFKKNLVINRLILFGNPVQTETKDLVKSKIFKKVYNIYSRGDIIQVMDIVSTKSAHSKRRFEDSPNLVQIEIEVDNYKPLHNELWLLGKKSNFIYRRNFPFFPLPLMIFAPIITSFIEDKTKNTKNINLKILTKKDVLNFNFYDSDLKRKICKNTKTINSNSHFLNKSTGKIDVKPTLNTN